MTMTLGIDNATTGSILSVSQWYYVSAASTDTTVTWYQPSTGAVHRQQQPPAPRVRQAPPREFNKFINASDLMEEFIAFLGAQGVRQSEAMGLPVELFIKWLIIRACEADGEQPDVVLTLPTPRNKPRCLGCGQFVQRQLAPPLHDQRCADLLFKRRAQVQP